MAKKFIFDINNLTGGGAEKVVTILANNLADLGNEVIITIRRSSPNDYYVSDKVKVVVIDDKREKYNKNNFIHSFKRFKARIKFRKTLYKTFEPDYIIPFLDPSARECFLANRRLKYTFVPSLRYLPISNKSIITIIMKYVFSHSSAVYFQTERQRKLFSKKIQNKGFVLENPISPNFLSLNGKKNYSNKIKNLVAVGRLNEQKNFALLINAVSKLHANNPEVNLKIYGTGSLLSDLQVLIDSNGASEYIKLMGRVNDVSEALLNSDAFIMTSNFEGMPNALMEAMCIGLPCVSTNCPTGPKELIGDNERGLLIPCSDESSLISAITTLITDNEYAISLGKRASEYIIKEFSPEVICSKLITFLNNVNNKEV